MKVCHMHLWKRKLYLISRYEADSTLTDCRTCRLCGEKQVYRGVEGPGIAPRRLEWVGWEILQSGATLL